MEIVKKLMVHMERAEGTLYRDELLTRMIEICSQNNYQHVVDFEWYITVLSELTEMETSAKHGKYYYIYEHWNVNFNSEIYLKEI